MSETIVTPIEQGSNLDPENEMAALLNEESATIDFPKEGEIRQGIIASITSGQILVSVGTKSEGIITGKELEIIPEEDLKNLEVGKEISVYIINPEDHNGNVVLSYMQAREEESWKKAEEMMSEKTAFDSKIVGYNKGGLIVSLDGLRGFIPSSQISLTRRLSTEGENAKTYKDMVGEPITCRVIEVDRERRRLIFSERAASSETRESVKERILETLKEGDVREGRVTSIADFGAFVNINGADGLVHLSEISWNPVKNPAEVLKVGDKVSVKIISVDKDKKRIGLSIRQTQEDPWGNMVSKYEVGQLVEGTITRLTKFGAFAKLEDDIEGLIHISEVSDKRIDHAREVLKEGEKLTLRIIKIEPAQHRIGLSVRRVDSMAYADQDWKSLMED